MMDAGGMGEAFGGGKAGAPFDPLSFIKRPPVVLRICGLLFSIIVFGCISAQGWQYNQTEEKEQCIMNGSNSTCTFGNGVAIFAFIAAIGFLVGEYFFEQMSSVKTRKHYVIFDLGFSGFWSFLYFVSFCVMTHQWSKSPEPTAGYGHSNIGGAIFFSFVSIFIWAGNAFFGWQRLQTGTEAAFSSGLEEGGGGGGGYQGGTGYAAGDTGYNEPPFSNQQQGGSNHFQQVQY